MEYCVNLNTFTQCIKLLGYKIHRTLKAEVGKPQRLIAPSSKEFFGFQQNLTNKNLHVS